MFRNLGYAFILTFAINAGELRSQAPGEQIKIGLSVTEETGGNFRSEFASAFRRLGDVSVVTIEETPDFLLRVVAMCSPDRERCSTATHYSVAFTFTEPMSYSLATLTTEMFDSTVSQEMKADYWDMLRGYETFHAMWTASWGRSVYRDAVAETVAEIDSRCFEKERLLRRWADASREGRTDAANALQSQIRNGNWLC